MGRWIRRVFEPFSAIGTLYFMYFMVQAIRWAFEDEGAVKVAGWEFDERLLSDVYGVFALLCGLAMIVLVAPFFWRRFGGKLKPKSYRCFDLLEEISQVAHEYQMAQYRPSAGGQERLRQIVRNLAELGITVPQYDYGNLEWGSYLARLGVLAEQKQYEQAKTLWAKI